MTGASGDVAARHLSAPGAVLLVSCYELGHQPFALASPWAQLEAAGFGVAAVDASVEPIDDEAIARAWLVAISVPMHTALRLGVEVARRVRLVNSAAHLCMFGLYASMNGDHLLRSVADSVIGGEFEQALLELAMRLDSAEPLASSAGLMTLGRPETQPILRRVPFLRPRRDGLPPLSRYAKLLGPREGETRTVGYVEASRGCLHQCLHCPITPVYEGRFFIVPRDIVIADAEQQIAAGALHITFGDPDFFNGVGHSMAIARELHHRHPQVTFDVTTKIEHVLKHRERFAELASLGCIFAVSAVESLSDTVLEELDKGHSRADVFDALAILNDAGIAMRPSFVAFTPWTTLDDYIALCDFIVEAGLVDHTDPIQLAIRLLIPPGSAILWQDRPRSWLGELVDEEFGYRWSHPDPRMDALFGDVTEAVDRAAEQGEDPGATFANIRALAYAAAARTAPAIGEVRRRFVPKLSEPWFCCAEPNARQLDALSAAARAASDACCKF